MDAPTIIIILVILTLLLIWLLRNTLCPPRHTKILLPLHLKEASSEACVQETNRDASFEFVPRIGAIMQARQLYDENGPSVILQPKSINPYGSQIAVISWTLLVTSIVSWVPSLLSWTFISYINSIMSSIIGIISYIIRWPQNLISVVDFLYFR